MKIEVSNGEIVDKFTILKLKLEKADPNSEKYFNIKKEHDMLKQCVRELNISEIFINEMYEVNKTLWEIEDNIRSLEAKKAFDETFVNLARSVYITNDIRFSVKDKINKMTLSDFREEKILPLYE